MEFEGVYQTSFTIPTGATSGERITLDGTRGAVFVYSNAGNLIGSLSGSAGTDGFGNAYPVGFTEYADVNTNIAFTNMFSGIVYEGFLANRASTPDYNHISFLAAQSSLTSAYQSPWTAGNSFVQMLFTAAAGTTMGVNSPNLALAANGSVNTDLFMSILGAIAGGDSINGIAAWQAPSYNANWSASSTYNGQSPVTPLHYRKDAENNLWLYGCFAAGGTLPGTTVFVLPVGYRPVSLFGGNNQFLDCQRDSAGTVTTGRLRIDTSGNVVVANANGLGLVINDQFFANGKIPLGQIP